MDKKQLHNLGREQLGRIMTVGKDKGQSWDITCDGQATAELLQKWLNNPFCTDSPLLGPLFEKSQLSACHVESSGAKSLSDVLLDEKSDAAVFRAVSDYARKLSASLSSDVEHAIAFVLYYASVAASLVFHGRKIGDDSYTILAESFSDLAEKKWIPRKLKELFGKSRQLCRDRQTESQNIPAAKSLGRIGSYRLLSILGEGGMGIVYLAEQEQPIKRKVALKVIKPGMDSALVVARFEAERQALALLNHPNIAHVHDAGTAENGRPYFVMEYVKGISITEYCDQHKLSIEDRLALFLQVCRAVEHAHLKGIIHRDVKPSNILVTNSGDQVVPKVIDFGVARAINQPLTERTLYTEQGQLVGTPEYMSPEQAQMANEDIDTRSDVYSLGVLLYVLLTGALPFDPETLRQGGVDRIRRTIRDEEPKTPSRRLSSLGVTAEEIALNRRTDAALLSKRLRKELEWIPLKAMRKERDQRYQSASELANDVRSYLQGIPIIAGPESAVYRLRKFVQRHKALVTGAAAVIVVLLGGIIVSTIFAIGQARARAEAEQQAKISEAVSDFLRSDLLASVDPHNAIGRELTVDSFLDAASQRLEGRFEDEPLVEASIRTTLADTYRNLCQFKQAEYHQMRALELYREHVGEEHPDMLNCMCKLGLLYWRLGRYDEAGDIFVKIVKRGRRVLGSEHPSTLHYMNGLALQYWLLGRYDEAEPIYLETLEIARRVLGEAHDQTLLPMGNLALLYGAQGRYEEAESLFLTTLETGRRVWGPEHPFTLDFTLGLGMAYRDWGRYKEAEQVLTDVLAHKRRTLGANHVYTVWAMNELADLYIKLNRYSEAKSLLEDALQIGRRVSGGDHPFTLSSQNGLAVLYTKQKQYNQAEHLFGEVLAAKENKLGRDHPSTLETMNDLAVLYMEQSRHKQAEELLLEALEGRRLKLGDTHPHTLESRRNLTQLYKAWGKPDEVQNWRAKPPDSPIPTT